MTILSKILAEEIHKTPGKILAGDAGAPRQDPCQRRQRGHYQARTNQLPAAVRMQLPAQPVGQAPAWHMQLPGELSMHLRGGMQIFMEAPPSCRLSCLPAYMAPHASLARAHVEARRSGDGRDGPRSRPR